MLRGPATVLIAVFLSGCATLFSEDMRPVSLNSNPVGASVLIDGNVMGTTPLTLDLSNHEGHTIVFQSEGYVDFTCVLEVGTGLRWVILDALGGFIPIIVDAATGNWQELQSDVCNATLSR